MTGAPPHPQFCAWCGTPLAYEQHDHHSRAETLAEQARAGGENPPRPPERVEELLRGQSYVGACPGCRVLSHVIGHKAGE